MKRTPLAAVTVVALVAGGCAVEQAPAADPWQPCPELLVDVLGEIDPAVLEQLAEQVTLDCTTVEVPQDWDDPDGSGTFDIALVRARSETQQARIGSLLINPGGPGASGVEAAVTLSLGQELGGLPEQVTRRFDVVGFDPRGVGRSSPVECFTDDNLDENYGADPDPVSPAEFDAAVAANRQLFEACAAEYGQTLGYYSTRQTAHDLDALREAVGDDQLTYLGYSYGTLLGAVYAQLYPERIRAMVLDGAIDPQQDIVASSQRQAEGFERALDNFAQWCDQAPDECPLQPDARTAIADAIEAAGETPVAGDDGREATGGWVTLAVTSALYTQAYWQPLAAAIDQLAGGDPTGAFDLADAYTGRDADGEYPNMFEANSAVNCADDGSGVTESEVRDLQEQWREEYPLFGAQSALGVLGCVLWPAEPDPYPTGPATGAPPILVVGTTGDPATPYESTARLADMLGVGEVVTWEGEGHTAYPKTACITEVVDAYLIDLTVPLDDVTCPAE